MVGLIGKRRSMVKRVDHRYQSGLVEVEWVAECNLCGRRTTLGRQSLARDWERTHARVGCRRRLVLDESGRGWLPCTSGWQQ